MKEVDDLLEEVLKESANMMMEKDIGFDSDSDLESEGELEEEEDSDDEEEEELEDEEDENVESEWMHSKDNILTLEKRLSEKVFELCMSFIMQTFKQLEERKSPWIHFCGVLAIDWRKERFREPRNYLSMVSGILWVARLFFLEYSLPKYGYESLNWPSRDLYEDFNWRFEEVRKKYLLKSSCTVVGNIINMLAYGKELSRHMGREPVITWDYDGGGLILEKVTPMKIEKIRVTMEGFKSFVMKVVAELKTDLKEEMMFGFNMLKLDIENMNDLMSESKKGMR